jgi:hypothetical protein
MKWWKMNSTGHVARMGDMRNALRILETPRTVAEQSKAWNVLACLNTGLVGFNPPRGMDVCLCFFWFVLSCVGCGLAAGWSPVQGDLPTVYKIHSLRLILNGNGWKDKKGELWRLGRKWHDNTKINVWNSSTWFRICTRGEVMKLQDL